MSLTTYGTSQFTSLNEGGRIILTGLNDVYINSTIGKDNAGLGLLQISSTTGTLTVAQESGWLENRLAVGAQW